MIRSTNSNRESKEKKRNISKHELQTNNIDEEERKTLSNKNKSDSKAFYFDFYIYVSHWIMRSRRANQSQNNHSSFELLLDVFRMQLQQYIFYVCDFILFLFWFRWHCILHVNTHDFFIRYLLIFWIKTASNNNKNILINRKTYYIDILFTTEDLYLGLVCVFWRFSVSYSQRGMLRSPTELQYTSACIPIEIEIVAGAEWILIVRLETFVFSLCILMHT